MATYWHKHPRGFANECSLFRAENPAEAAWLREHEYERLTRHELGQHVRWINAENDAWGSGRAFGRINLRQIITPELDPHGEYSLSCYLARMGESLQGGKR